MPLKIYRFVNCRISRSHFGASVADIGFGRTSFVPSPASFSCRSSSSSLLRSSSTTGFFRPPGLKVLLMDVRKCSDLAKWRIESRCAFRPPERRAALPTGRSPTAPMIRAKAGRKSLCRVAQLKPPLESTKGLVGGLVSFFLRAGDRLNNGFS